MTQWFLSDIGGNVCDYFNAIEREIKRNIEEQEGIQRHTHNYTSYFY